MSFKNYIGESKNNSLDKWKKSFVEFSKAATELSNNWENVDIQDKAFLSAYSKLFKHSFDEVSYELMELSHKASNIKG